MNEQLPIASTEILIGWPFGSGRTQRVPLPVGLSPGVYQIDYCGEYPSISAAEEDDPVAFYLPEGDLDELDVFVLAYDATLQDQLVPFLVDRWAAFEGSRQEFVLEHLPAAEKALDAKISALWLYEIYDEDSGWLRVHPERLSFHPVQPCS